MNAEIIAVGTEILLGDIMNTHAQFLAKELAALGFDRTAAAQLLSEIETGGENQ